MPDGALETRLRAQAATIVRRSWQHLGASVVLCVAIAAWFSTQRAPAWAYGIVVGVGALSVTYDLLRIAVARRALRDPSRLEGFASGQRRSHRVRGRVYLVAAPMLIVATWLLAFASAPSAFAPASWAVLAFTTLSLMVGWWMWLRVVRRIS